MKEGGLPLERIQTDATFYSRNPCIRQGFNWYTIPPQQRQREGSMSNVQMCFNKENQNWWCCFLQMVNPPKQSQQCKKDNLPPPQTLELQELVPRDFSNLFWICSIKVLIQFVWAGLWSICILQVFAGGGQGRENCCDARYNLWYCSSARIVGRCKKIQMMCCGLWTSDVLGYTPYCLTTCHRVSVSCFARCCFLTGHVGISRKNLGSKIFETRQCDCQGGCSTWNWPNRNRTTSQQRVVSASCETSRPSAGATWL